MNNTIRHDVAFFDFLRGGSALVVFFHHAAILGGGPGLLLGAPGREGVNAFMLASGFLIYFQCASSGNYDQLRSWPGIRNFYTRRFFRIAPAYYVALTVALLLSVQLGQCRELIASVLPYSATVLDRYYIKDFVTCALTHLSFVFGLLPQYSFSTPLPDWSIGLEMQFYLIFPLLYAGFRRNFAALFPATLLTMFTISAIADRAGIHYPMPSLLPLKFHNFAAGIALAYLMLPPSASRRRRLLIIATVVLALVHGNRSLTMPALFSFGCWLLLSPRSSEGLRGRLNRIFAHRLSKFLADVSYSVYILHLLLMLPFFALALRFGTPSPLRWGLLSGILLAATLALAYASYRFVETPGIRQGKRLLCRAGPAFASPTGSAGGKP